MVDFNKMAKTAATYKKGSAAVKKAGGVKTAKAILVGKLKKPKGK